MSECNCCADPAPLFSLVLPEAFLWPSTSEFCLKIHLSVEIKITFLCEHEGEKEFQSGGMPEDPGHLAPPGRVKLGPKLQELTGLVAE